MGNANSPTEYDSKYVNDYSQSYYGQEPKDRDGYGFSTYERQKPEHYGEMPSGRDGYGNPIYGDNNDN